MKRIIFFLLVALLSIQNTYAFWTKDILSANDFLEVSIIIGEWDFIIEWEESPEESYQEGQIVFYEGNYYIATKPNVPNGISPDNHPASWVFWDPYN